METYSVIEIGSGNLVLVDKTHEECLNWIINHGDIINYTIINK
jgi:hypothetical protein